MSCRVLIVDYTSNGFFEAISPEKLAQAGPLWAKDVRALAPFKPRRTGLAGIPDSAVWESQTESDGPAILVCGNSSSTFDIAWRFIETNTLRAWDSVVALSQSAGRGQRKRQWISPIGNIYASWLWPSPEKRDRLESGWQKITSLVAGFIFTQAFKDIGVCVKIKWPNDLLIDDRKVGGILVESRKGHILVGVGINVSFSPEDGLLREQGAVTATHLLKEGVDTTPLELWKYLVSRGKILFEILLNASSPKEMMRLIDAQMAWKGETVLIQQPGQTAPGIILGVADDGGLRVKINHKTEVIYSGSIIPAG